MRRRGLDLDVLRGEKWRRGRPTQTTVTDVVSSSGELVLTRRELLTLAGMAAVALPPFEKTVRPTLLGPVEYVVGPRRVALRLRGRDRWVIDLSRFAGNPRLLVQKADNYLRLEVKGARYPGTELAADMVCELRHTLSGWKMKLQMAAGRFRGEVPLESWLAGLKPCRGRVRLKGEGGHLGDKRQLVLSGEAEAEFYPDWRLEIKGSRVAQLTGLGAPLASDEVTVCLLERGSPSLLKDPPSKRTAVVMKRGGYEWRLDDHLPSPRNGKVLAEANTFDEIRLEIGEGGAGSGRGALLACCSMGAGQLRCLFGGDGDRDGAFEMALRNPRFAVAVEPSGEQAALVSDFDEDAGWLHTEGYSLQLGGTPDCPPFEVVAYDGQVRRMRCEPALLKMSVPLPDAVTEPTPMAPGTRIAFVAAGTQVAQGQRRPGGGAVQQSQPARRPGGPERQPDKAPAPQQPAAPAQPTVGAVQVRPGGVTVLHLPNPTVTVIRPKDLLCLTFEFINLEIKGQPPQLQRVKTDTPAYIVVHFPPQHIAEEAILEDSPEFKEMAKDPIPSPPVRARMAGQSRLAFRLPEGMNQVPLTLQALLDWTKFELSVVPLALPPPEPAKLVVPTRAIRGYKPPAPAALPKQPVLEGPPPELQQAPRPGPAPGPLRMPALPEDDDRPTNRPAITFVAAAQPAAPAAPPTAERPAPTAVAAPAVTGKFIYLSIREPLGQETAIEAPYRLIVSPHAGVGWVHATSNVEHGGRTELWHTRMGVRTADGKIYDRQYEYVVKDGKLVVSAVSPAGDIMERLRTMRCVWSPDYAWPLPTAPDKPTPFRMSLDQRDRAELVALTCGYGRMADWQSRVVETDTLMLSALGAWMNVRYGANLPKEALPLSIEEWRHRMAMGRDQYVSVVYAGYLFPFGHRACLVKVTERKFYPSGQGYVAYLFQRYFLRVREPVKYYPAYGQANNARRMPLRMVRILTLVTPTLRAPEQSKVLPDQPCSARCGFWPTVGNEPFRFRMVGEDWDGQQVEFEVPVIFVGVENVTGSKDRIVAFDEGPPDNPDQSVMKRFVDEYNKTTPEMLARRTARVPGQKMAFAESSPDKPGDTTLQVEELIFGAELDDPKSKKTQKELRANNQPRFYPNVAAAKARIPAVEQLTGKTTPTTIRIHERYVNEGWSSNPNPAQVFAELWDLAAGKAAPVPLLFSADQAGGVATPNMDIQGLSRQFGPISDLANMLAGKFDPSSFFPDVGQLFGAVRLKDILEAIFGPDQVPAITTNIEKDEYGVPKAVVAKLTWRPKMKPWPAGKPIFATRSGTSMKIEAVMRTELSLSGPGQTSAKVEGSLEKFDLNLLPIGGYDYFIQLQFDRISFVSGTGQKTDVKCDFSNMKFGGPLEFVSTLQKLIPLNGFGDGPYLDVGLDGIKAGFDLELPDVSVGMFSLSNMRLSAGMTLPFFEGSLRFRFAFCDKQSPFNLAVSLFGGGGFFALELTPKEVALIEAAFEFGGSIAFDIGVASGGVYAMAGIYFRWETDGVLLEGYLRMGGHLSVLGLVTLSLEFYMSLTYEKSGGKTSVRGRAELTVEIEILFFTKSVTMEVERQFAGSSSGAAYLDGTRFAMLSTDARYAQGGGGGRPGASQRVRFADQMTAADWAAYCKAFD